VRFGASTDKRRLRQSDVLQNFLQQLSAPGDNAISPGRVDFDFSLLDDF
jgi:hypothetical protein